jgi:hypothetical protein
MELQSYIELESLIIADYEPQTTIERVLVERLASLLWRIRRAFAIETGLFQTQAPTFRGPREIRPHHTNNPCEMPTDPIQVFRNLLHQNKPARSDRNSSKRELRAQAPPIQDPPSYEFPSQELPDREVPNPTTAKIDPAQTKNQTRDITRCTALSRRFLRLANTDCGILASSATR